MERSRLVQVLLLLFLATAFSQYYSPHINAVSSPNSALPFSSSQTIEHLPGTDLLTTAVQLSNGTILVAWISNQAGNGYNVYLNLWNGSSWRKSFNVTSSPQNQAPTLAQLADNTIILVYSSNQTTTNHYNLWYMTSMNGRTWSSARALTSGAYSDYSPKAIVTSDSSLWIVWERDTPTGPLTAPYRQIFYKTLKSGQWYPETTLTNTTVTSQSPSVASVNGGNIWVAYTRTATSSPSRMTYRSFNGTQWSTETMLTNPTNNDNMPSLVQDRNGTMWLFWQRDLPFGTVTLNKLFYKYSADPTQLASAPDTQLTFAGNSTVQIQDLEPYVLQGGDTRLWLFYSSNSYHNDYDIYYMTSQSIYPVHQVTSTVQVSPGISYPWGDAPTNIVTITVTVTNTGDLDEYVNVSVKAVNGTVTYTVGGQSNFVYFQTSTVFTFTWNTAGYPPGKYTILVTVPATIGETLGNAMGNNSSYKTLNILLAGALAKTNCITIIDAGMMGKAFGTIPGNVNWNPDADLDNKGVITIISFGILAAKFGKCL